MKAVSLLFLFVALVESGADDVIISKASPLTMVNPVHALAQSIKQSQPAEELFIQSLAKLSPAIVYNHTFEEQDSCAFFLNQLFLDLTLRKEGYALQMADSWGKMGSGILRGNLIWLGRFGQCMDAKPVNFTTKYCIPHLGPKTPMLGAAGLTLGSCFPADCSVSNITSVFEAVVETLPIKGNVSVTVSCPTQFATWEGKDILGVVILVVIFIIVFTATLYEYFLIAQFHKRNMRDETSDKAVLYSPAVGINENLAKHQQLFLCFSAKSNIERLLSTEQKTTDIHCLHGMRFLSMSWVILGHSFLFVALYTDNIYFPASYLVNHWEFQAIVNGTFSVDSFFFLSGLLAVYIGLREVTKRNGSMNVPLMYLLRYIRLTPAYAFCILMSVSIWPKMGSGPVWPALVNPLSSDCAKYWWSNLLYINNLYPANMATECYAWGWYLANDMQFYLFLPLILYLLYRWPTGGLAVTCGYLLSSIIITGVFSSITDQQPQIISIGQFSNQMVNPKGEGGVGDANSLMNNLYISDLYAKPWCRIGAYMVGILAGYIMFIRQRNLKIPKIAVIIGWLTAIAINCSVIYGLFPTVSHGDQLSVNTAAFYNAMSRPMWCVGLAWVVIACANGYGGLVNSFLSWKGFIPLSRLTYCAYLIHPMVIWWYFGTQEVLTHYSIQSVMLLFLGSLVLANLLAFLVHLLVEAPIIALTKILTGKVQQTKPVQTVDVQFENQALEFGGEATA